MKALKKTFSLILALLFLAGLPFNAYALPAGEQVVSGDASFQQTDANTLAITTSDKAIINYNTFNIAQAETVRFIQPSSSSVVLNRVIGVDPSQLYGSLLANGQVFLVNPNGIFFGPNSMVDSGSFVASTLDISNQDFLSGNYRFALEEGASPSYIVNKGSIKVSPEGFVVLASPLVSNEGVISANVGQVVIGGTSKAVINLDGENLINFVIPHMEGEPGNVLIPREHVTDLIKSVVNTPQLVEAGAVVEENGVVKLVGAEGLVINGGTITASGSAGARAGRVLVNSAQATVLAPASSITANGSGEGSSGGEIKILSDMQSGLSAVLSGARLEAKGSEVSGDGGFIELSANEFYLIDGASISASAANGVAGLFLLDPTDITIQDAAGDMDPGAAGVFIPTGNTNTVSDDAIETFLNGGTSVQISTVSAFAGPGGGDITQNADAQINKTAGTAATITLTAEDTIELNGGIVSTSSTLGVVLVATAGVDINAAITTNGGTFSSSGTTFDNTGGAINTNGGAVAINHSGAATIGAAIGGVTAAGITNITGSVIQLGAAVTSSSAAITFHSPVTLTNAITVTSGNGAITFDSTIDGTQTLSLQAGTGDVTTSGATGATVALSSLDIDANDISLFSIGGASAGVGGATTLTTVNNGGDTGSITFTGTTYNANAQTYDASAGSQISVNAGAPVTFTSNGSNVSFTGAVTLQNSSNLSVLTAGTAPGLGDITFGSIGATSSEDLTLNAASADVTVGGIGSADQINTVSITAATITVNGDITTSDLAGNTVTLTGNVLLGGAITIDTNNATFDGNVYITGTVDNPQAFVITAGEADVTIDSVIGFTAPLTSLTITGNDISLASIGGGIIGTGAGVTGAVLVTATDIPPIPPDPSVDIGSITLTGTTYNANAQTYDAGSDTNVVAVNAGAPVTITSTADNIVVTGTLALADGSDLIVNSAGTAAGSGDISLGAIRGTSSEDVTINAGLALAMVGLIGDADEINTVDITGSTINLNGNIVTSDALTNTVTLTGNVVLLSDVSIDTNNATNDGDVHITGTVDGAHAFAVDAGGADVALDSAIGATTPLSILDIDGNDITFLSNIGGALHGVSGATTVTAADAGADAGSITLTGTTYNANAQSYDAGADINVISVNAGAPTTFTSTEDNIVFTGTTTLSDGTDLIVTTAGTAAAAGDVTMGIIRATSSEDLTINAGAAQAAVGAIGDADEVNTVSITGSAIILNGNITTSDLAGNTVTLTGNAALGADVTIDTNNATNDGDVSITGTLDGAHIFVIDAGGADITIGGATGATTALTSLDLDGNDISLASIGGAITAGVTGATTVTAADAGADIGGITLTGTIYNANAQDYDASAVHVGADPNPITISAGAPTTFTSSDDDITLEGVITLASGSDLSINTGSAGAGNILFDGTLNGTTAGQEDLTLNAGTGNINFNYALGGGISLGAITINSALDVTAASTISAASFTQAAGTGTTTFNALLSTTGNVSVTTGVITLAGTGSINANAGAGDVTLSAQTGAITGGAAAVDITAGNIYLSAVTGIGSAGVLLTQASGLQAANSTSGDIRVSNTGALDVIGTGVTNINGSVYLTLTGELTLMAAVRASYIELTAQTAISDNDDGGADDVVSGGDAQLVVTNSGTIGTDNPLEVKIGGRLYIGVDGMVNTISAVLKGTTSDGMVHLLYPCPGLVIFNGSIVVFNGAQQITQGLAQLNPYIANILPAYMAMTLFTVDDNFIKPRIHPIE